MADFRIDVSEGSAAYEGQVTSAEEINANSQMNILKGVFGVLDAGMAAPRGGANVATQQRSALMTAIVEETGGLTPAATRSKVNTLVAQAAMGGYSVSQQDRDAIFGMSGVVIQTASEDPEFIKRQAMYNDEAFLRFISIAETNLGNDAGSEAIEAEAVKNYSLFQNNVQYLESTKVANAVEFKGSYLPRAQETIAATRKIFMAAYNEEVIRNGEISPEAMARLGTEVSFLKNLLAVDRPADVPESDYQLLTNQINALDDLYKVIKGFDAEQLTNLRQDGIEVVDSLIIASAQNVEDPVWRRAILDKDFSKSLAFQNYTADGLGDQLKFLKNLPSSPPPPYVDIYDLDAKRLADNLRDASTASQDLEVFSGVLHSPEALESVRLLTDEANGNEGLLTAFQMVETGLAQATMTTAASLSIPVNLESFFQGIGKATVVLTDKNIVIDPFTMRKLYSPEMLERLAEARKHDPDGAVLAQARLRDIVNKQLAIVAQAGAGSLADSPFRVNSITGDINYDLDKVVTTGQVRFDTSTAQLVKKGAKQFYNGDVALMIADRGRRFFTEDGDNLLYAEIENLGWKFDVAYSEYLKATKVLGSVKPLREAFTKLGGNLGTVPSSSVTFSGNRPINTGAYKLPLTGNELLLTNFSSTSKNNPELNPPVDEDATTYTQDNPYTFEMDLTEDEYSQAFQALKTGDVYRDPSDGELYTK